MKKYFTELLGHIGACATAQSDALYDSLLSRYAEPQRYYHTAAHLEDLFRLLDENRVHVKDRPALIAAILFHDAVYDPRSSTNEEDSARLAVFNLASLGASQEFCTRVAGLIRMTATHRAPAVDADACLFLDMDMAILGADAQSYAAYAANIRREYEPSFGADGYNRGRLEKFIAPCLAAPRLFMTDIMNNKYGTQAQANLRWEKAALEAQLSPKPGNPSP